MPAINIEGSGPTGEEDAALQFTPRGFAVYTMFEDTYGNNVRVQESSSAEGPHIWIFCDPMNPDQKGVSPHLSLEQAEHLRDALGQAIERGKRIWDTE